MMQYPPESPFHRLLATRHTASEPLALELLSANPEIARLQWPAPDVESDASPFIVGSTALHYAADDGKLELMRRLIEFGAGVNASKAWWFRSVLAWAANNARLDAMRLLFEHGASPRSPDALHAAAWGGSTRGQAPDCRYVEALRLLIDAGADLNSRDHWKQQTPLAVALESGHQAAIDFLRARGASEQ